MLGFLGPNGAGKTTAMRAVFGLVELDAGEVLWDGRPVGLAERLRFGYMPEERGLYPRMPVGEQLEYFGASARARPPARRARAAAALARAARPRRPRRREGRGALAREPAARAARGGAAARAGAARARRAVRRARPGRRAHARRGAPRRGGARRGRPLLQPPARARRGHLRGGRDHRPRPHRRDRRRRRAETRARSGGGSSFSSRARRRSGCRTSPGVELVERRNGDLRLLARPRRRPGAGARRGGADGTRRRVQLRPALPRRSSSWSWWRHERAARDHARRPARDPRAPAQPRVPHLDACSCSCSSAASTALAGRALERSRPTASR